MDDVAKSVGISKRTLYENFSSKEKLIEVIIDSTLSKIDLKDSTIANDDSIGSIEKLKRIGLVIVEELRFLDEKVIYEAARYYPKQYDKVDKWLCNRSKLQESIIKKGIEVGEIRDVNYDVLLKVLNVSKTWLLDKDFLHTNDLTISEGVKALIDIVLFGVANN